jgi:hypothetical protein
MFKFKALKRGTHHLIIALLKFAMYKLNKVKITLNLNIHLFLGYVLLQMEVLKFFKSWWEYVRDCSV